MCEKTLQQSVPNFSHVLWVKLQFQTKPLNQIHYLLIRGRGSHHRPGVLPLRRVFQDGSPRSPHHLGEPAGTFCPPPLDPLAFPPAESVCSNFYTAGGIKRQMMRRSR